MSVNTADHHQLVSPGLRAAPHVFILQLMLCTEPQKLLVTLFGKLDHIGGGRAEREYGQKVRGCDARIRDRRREEEAIAKGYICMHIQPAIVASVRSASLNDHDLALNKSYSHSAVVHGDLQVEALDRDTAGLTDTREEEGVRNRPIQDLRV